ncbi:MAG TPA: hypothetical protein RMH85_13030 [Polyangiaceae bacterium LLY-WYZ-15_(1-7)]|nr:hypothetical protein [Myxococcales bacterium]MAT25249.1 hypothetical protein [Sandaracinus sp.]HJK94256.1 hypothetical protein [Polyangiaceae bacterium LLY-WYZ-15_(1-7)]MBJ72519.1 hypothetical protein [Sandaracinus sp.]HJL03535.1 hypothetical protein [Polyangiaceae bacterium LLY-WYZ-15_(1-7)]
MGTGTITLWWYVACCGFVIFTGLTTALVIAYGNRKRRRARALRAAAREARERERPDEETPD